MAQFGKASAKRGKPSYIYAIIGVTLVLFLFGIVGWFFLNIRKTGEHFKETIQVNAWIELGANKKGIDSLKNYISRLPYVMNVEYVTKEKAIQRWNAENDTTWKKFLSNNPLPESIDFFVKADYMQKDSLVLLGDYLTTNYHNTVSEFAQTMAREEVACQPKSSC